MHIILIFVCLISVKLDNFSRFCSYFFLHFISDSRFNATENVETISIIFPAFSCNKNKDQKSTKREELRHIFIAFHHRAMCVSIFLCVGCFSTIKLISFFHFRSTLLNCRLEHIIKVSLPNTTQNWKWEQMWRFQPFFNSF